MLSPQNLAWLRFLLSAVVTATVAWGLIAASQAPAAPQTFAARVAALSEPGGYFDTDNLISNERSYLHVVPALRIGGLQGGAYLGVGPDQNFSYIAHARPALAIVVDIRRDNMLLHLLFKGLFELSPTRVEYLARLTARAPPEDHDPDAWASRSIDEIVAYIDGLPRIAGDALDILSSSLRAVIEGYGVPLGAADFETIARFHRRFVAAGLSLQFNSTGRPPQWNYPTYRDLLLETDREGIWRSFLAREDDYQYVRSLQARDLVIPVVGDLAGDTALRSIAAFLRQQELAVSAFYASNVEFYLFRQGMFDRFVGNLERLPRANDGLIVRSAFTGARPDPGYNSASMVQDIRELVEGYAQGRFRRYQDILAASR